MFSKLTHTVAVGAISAGALLAGILGASVASAAPDGLDGADLIVTTAPQPPFLDPGPKRPDPKHQVGNFAVIDVDQPTDLTYCPPGFHTAPNAIPIPGVPKGCEPSIP